MARLADREKGDIMGTLIGLITILPLIMLMVAAVITIKRY